MDKHLLAPAEVSRMIASGRKLLLAGDGELLKSLPEGAWIAGSSPYFMDADGGQVCRDKIFVNDITDFQREISIKTYNENTLKNIYSDGFKNGFTVLIIPPCSRVHYEFALNAPDYKEFAVIPLIGWVSCYGEDKEKEPGLVFSGSGSSGTKDLAVAMHVRLPEGKYADMNLINIYSQGKGEKIEFLENGFSAREVIADGKKRKVGISNLDITLPIVANYNSAMINVSHESIQEGFVTYFAPVFKGVEYRFAEPIEDIEAAFAKLAAEHPETPLYASVCILCYRYGKLEGKHLGGIVAPITYGEICYQLVNQTIVTLDVKDI